MIPTAFTFCFIHAHYTISRRLPQYINSYDRLKSTESSLTNNLSFVMLYSIKCFLHFPIDIYPLIQTALSPYTTGSCSNLSIVALKSIAAIVSFILALMRFYLSPLKVFHEIIIENC